MHQGLSAENKTQGEAGAVQRAGPTVSSLLLSAAGPVAVYCAFKQVSRPQQYITPITVTTSLASIPFIYFKMSY